MTAMDTMLPELKRDVGINLAMTLTHSHLRDGSRTLGSRAEGTSLEGSIWLILSRLLIFSSCSALNPPSFIKISQIIFSLSGYSEAESIFSARS